MSFSDLFARGVALVGGAALQMRRLTEGAPEPAWGSAPVIPAGRPQGSIPTLKMPSAKGWEAGRTPVARPAPGNLFPSVYFWAEPRYNP